MENEMQIFSNQEFGNIRVVKGENGEPWFVGKDVAKVLGYAKPLDAIQRHVDEDDSVKRGLIDSIGRKQKAIFVNESGVYSLVMSSKLPEAKQFKHWVTSEVLPTIRKHGAYMEEATIDKVLENPDFLIRLATALKDEKQNRLLAEQKAQQLALENKALEEKVSYLDLILASNTAVNISQVAADYGMSAVMFNRMLRDMKIQYRCGRQWLLYIDYKDKGYVTSETVALKHENGNPFSKMHTKWTQRGREWLYNMLKKEGILPMIERTNVTAEA